MKKVAFYGRYSSSNQTEQSIEGQLHVCQKYAEQNGMEIAAQYIDRAISGTSDRRPQFQQMIIDSAAGAWNYVLVYKLDRFARNRYDSALYKKKLRDNGVRVISATEQISDSPEGIIMEGLLEAMDEYYSAELSRKMRRGMEESFRKGKFIQSTPPFGYKLTEQHMLALDPDTAPISGEIFRRYDAGEKIGQIAEWLNGQGLRKASGRPWSSMNVSRHLHHTVCKGEYRYGDFEGFMPCPAVIDAETFDRVQERLSTAAQRHRVRSGYTYLLTGKMICASCGRPVCGSTSQAQHYYYCRRCKDAKCVKADYLHEKVLHALAEYLTGEKTDEIADAAYAEYIAEEQPDPRPALEKELRSVETQLQNATQAILRGIDLDTLTDTINALKAQRDELRASLESVSAPIPKLTRDYFRAALSIMADKPGKELLDTVVNQIILKGDTVIICINLTDDDNVPPLEQILFKITEPPRGARRRLKHINISHTIFQLTRPSRGATTGVDWTEEYNTISTHTPLAGRDRVIDGKLYFMWHFNSHAPRGARPTTLTDRAQWHHFNSHAPRGARPTITNEPIAKIDFNSHAPRGARPLHPSAVVTV